MSDIPRAREILKRGLKSQDVKFCHYAMQHALDLLDREKPEFKTARKLPALTNDQADLVLLYREQGLPMNEIARKLGTNIGRVSEIINGHRRGI